MKIDLGIFVIMLAFGGLGAASGAVRQVAHWVGLILAGVASGPLSARLAPAVAGMLGGVPVALVEMGLTAVAFMSLFAAGSWGSRWALYRAFPPEGAKKTVDRWLGFGLGAGQAVAVAYLLLAMLTAFEGQLTSAVGPLPGFRDSGAVAFVRGHNLLSSRSIRVPGLAGLQGAMALAQDPKAIERMADDPSVKEMLEDPRIKDLMSDPAIAQAMQSGNPAAVLENPKLKALLSDPKISETVKKLEEKLAKNPPPAAGR